MSTLPKRGPYLVTGQKINTEKLELARHFRKNMTPEEVKLWQALRGSKLAGYHFRRQHIVSGFLADFYCAKAKLVLEIDRGIHEQQQGYDRFREEAIKDLGVRVLRIKNDEIWNDFEGVLIRVLRACKET